MVSVQVDILQGKPYAVVECGSVSLHVKIHGGDRFATELGVAVIKALQSETRRQPRDNHQAV